MLRAVTAYSILLLAAIALSGWYWHRLARRDHRLFLLYLAALFGALAGAKLGWFLAEGWMEIGASSFWLALATGKTILGGLLVGYLAVEMLKRVLGYRAPTGDWFATVVPLGIALGRVGCLRQGCCAGVPWTGFCALPDRFGVARWPSVPVEIAFNLLAAATFFGMRRRGLLAGQHFHLYLIAYGAFRFFHEWLRDTPRAFGPLTGYQLLALACVAAGAVGFAARARAEKSPA
ncbi:MAG: prolipoprotein diacylglyceryl transferase [Terrimicrobiaceae bacterium]|nr:prolipoprotein diacylglyceryl transferase [Terrimicrobiaceae bacterium]